ncbi:MAG: PAS domain S-box protein [Actinobacteria bacterium]|nr:PAS domain S-box protein [Actinomycetota bacterium]
MVHTEPAPESRVTRWQSNDAEPFRTETLTEVCHAIRVTLGVGATAVNRIVGDQLVVVAADDVIGFGLRPGLAAPLDETLCGRALAGRAPGDGVNSYLVVPLEDADGAVFGTLCAMDRRSVELDEHDQRLMRAFGAMLAREHELEAARLREQAARETLARQSAREAERSRLDQIVAELSAVFLRSEVEQTDEGVVEALTAVGTFLGADSGDLYLAEAERWVPGPGWRLSGVRRADAAVIPRPEVAGWETELGRGQVVRCDGPDPGSELLVQCHLMAGRPAGWALTVPVRAEDRLLGCLVFGSWQANPPGIGPAGVDLAVPLVQVGDLVAAALTRRSIAAELRTSESRYRTLIDDVADVVVHLEPDGRISFVNRTWTELTGLTLEDTVGAGPMDNVHPDDRPLAMAHMMAVMTGDDSQVPEVRFITKTGEVRWMEVKGRAVWRSDGSLGGLTGTVHDVTERRAAEAQVHAAREEAERARDAAERASQAKSEFLSRMSHELRTPLNAILGFSQLLELAELGPEDADSLRLITTAGQHLLSLINDALDIGRIESGGLSLSPEPVLLTDLVSECVGLTRTDLTEPAITLRVEGSDHIKVIADAQRLRQILVNLLSNAVKYNHAGGGATVTWGPAPDSDGMLGAVRLTVADTGKGIPPDRLEDAFVPFERLGAERTEVEGTGLGLAVVKRLTEAMGGRVSMSSVLGVGTSVHIDLPAASAG